MTAIATALITNRPKTTAAVAALIAAAVAAWLAGYRHDGGLGPLAAAAAGSIAAIYTAAAATAWHLALRRKRHREARRAAADTVAYLASDLAAGTDPARAVAAAEPDWPAEATATARRLQAALRIAAELGAPAAELCRRLAEHLNDDDQAAARAGAQTASIRATAALLVALPVAGVALGETALGVEAVAFLFANPAGIGAAATAMALQAAGLAWTGALINAVNPRST
ncbi:type II secretion system F family protein [Glycomyces sp. NPDC048151]|uniref:type II secretion system F family protein n=1 Tax=Glycomyces sp. NPDC048151 TaxID=3364002 RepID=UPI0037199755